MQRVTITGHGSTTSKNNYIVYTPSPTEAETDKLLSPWIRNKDNRQAPLLTEQDIYSRQTTEHPASSWNVVDDNGCEVSWIEQRAECTDTYEWDEIPDEYSGIDLAALFALLTPAQRRVAELLAEGKTETEIARVLKIRKNCVRTHIQAMRDAIPKLTIDGNPLPEEQIPLSPREAEIAARLTSESQAQIAKSLGIAKSTMSDYVRNIRQKGHMPEINYLGRYGLTDVLTDMTEHQKEIIKLIGEGLNCTEIGKRWGINPDGVSVQIRGIKHKQSKLRLEDSELEQLANELLKPYLYDRRNNPTGEIFTEQQINNKQGREIPTCDDWIIDKAGHVVDKYFEKEQEQEIKPLDLTVLTEKQYNICRYIIYGTPKVEIAEKMGVNKQAVNQHIKLINKN